eukprot:gene14651-16169_t
MSSMPVVERKSLMFEMVKRQTDSKGNRTQRNKGQAGSWIEDDSIVMMKLQRHQIQQKQQQLMKEQEVLGDPVEEATGQQENMEVQALTEQVTEPERRENGVQGQVEKRAEGQKMTDNEKNGRPTAG